MPDVSPYGVTQNADAARTTADALVGEHIPQTTENSVVGALSPDSTAPYRPPGALPPLTRAGRCTGKNGTCSAYPVGDTNLCIFHTPGWRGRWKETGGPTDAA